jgi:hypothetical protein
MNRIKKEIKDALDAMPDVSFSVVYTAKSGNQTLPIRVKVTGLEGECENPWILAKLKQKTADAVYKDIHPDVYDEELKASKMNDQLKSWCASILWWNFSDQADRTGTSNAPWSMFYRKWREKYDSRRDIPRAELKKALKSLGVEYDVALPGKKRFPVKIKIERGE